MNVDLDQLGHLKQKDVQKNIKKYFYSEISLKSHFVQFLAPFE
jgi:hypothetical protein